MSITCGKAILYVMTVGVSTLLWGSPVYAQETQPTAPVVVTKSGSELEEIVVTARKREETLISVPVIVTAVPQERLETLQTVSTTDLATMERMNDDWVHDFSAERV